MRHHAPAADRNKDAILAVLQEVLPAGGLVLEVASGSGQHAVHFAGALGERVWLPTDLDAKQVASINAWRDEYPHAQLLPPRQLDVTAPDWPAGLSGLLGELNAIVSINMIHIAPWAAAEGLFSGAQALLDDGGVLFLYGPFMRSGRHTAPSNAAFDDWLQESDPAWGVRDLDAVEMLAGSNGFGLTQVIEMPANNLSLVFVRSV